ncbi:unnamed protein product, partial [Heterotrigona itama]
RAEQWLDPLQQLIVAQGIGILEIGGTRSCCDLVLIRIRARGVTDTVESLLMPRISIAPGLAGPTLKKGEKEAIKLQGRKGR